MAVSWDSHWPRDRPLTATSHYIIVRTVYRLFTRGREKCLRELLKCFSAFLHLPFACVRLALISHIWLCCNFCRLLLQHSWHQATASCSLLPSISGAELPLMLTRASHCKPSTSSWEQQKKIPWNHSKQKMLMIRPPSDLAALIFKLHSTQLRLLWILVWVSPAESNQRCESANRRFTVSVNSEAQQLLTLKEQWPIPACFRHAVSGCRKRWLKMVLFCL